MIIIFYYYYYAHALIGQGDLGPVGYFQLCLKTTFGT